MIRSISKCGIRPIFSFPRFLSVLRPPYSFQWIPIVISYLCSSRRELPRWLAYAITESLLTCFIPSSSLTTNIRPVLADSIPIYLTQFHGIYLFVAALAHFLYETAVKRILRMRPYYLGHPCLRFRWWRKWQVRTVFFGESIEGAARVARFA